MRSRGRLEAGAPRSPKSEGDRSGDLRLVDLGRLARYHRDRHRLYAARVGGSRPVSLSKLEALRRMRELAEGSLRRAEVDHGVASRRGEERVQMAPRAEAADGHLDLQREADDGHPRTVRSSSGSEPLERFKRGEIDRWGARVDGSTPVPHFYVDRR